MFKYVYALIVPFVKSFFQPVKDNVSAGHIAKPVPLPSRPLIQLPAELDEFEKRIMSMDPNVIAKINTRVEAERNDPHAPREEVEWREDPDPFEMDWKWLSDPDA